MRSEYPDHETEKLVRSATGGIGESVEGVVDNPFQINPTYGDFDADDSDWDKDDPPTDTQGLELTITTRVVYDYTTYHLYAFSRVMTFDDRGCLVLVSEETRQTVDTLTQCPPEE
jgi:hypothetical protein